MAGRGGVHGAASPSCVSRSLDRTLSDAQDTCELKLSGRKLKDYPKAAAKYNLSDTVLADLSRNRLSEVPAEVTDYRSLETLNLYQNVIKHLPESLSCLQALTHLNLSRNQLSVIPGVVCSLAGLRVLDVSGNRLVSLPEELGRLHSLMQLDASYNQLAHLPPALGELDGLRSLNLRRNQLQTLPPELCFLRLVFLDLSGNRISTLPTELRFMGSLVTLALDNNPLQQPPASLCTRGRVHIFKRLEMIAAKEDKKRGILSTETEFRKTQLRKPSSCTDFRLVNGFFEPRNNKRSTVDSGYSTCDSVDQRWSQESQEVGQGSVEYEDPRKLAVRAAACTKEQRQGRGAAAGTTVRPLNGLPNGDVLGGVNGGVGGGGTGGDHTTSTTTPSALSTPSTLSPGDGFNLEDEFNKALKLRQDYENVFPGDHSSGKDTQREYVEAKLQRRALESNSIYRRQGSDGTTATAAAAAAENGTHRSAESLTTSRADHHHLHHNSSQHLTTRPGPIGAAKSCNGLDGFSQRLPSQPRLQDLTREDMTRADVKALQKEAVLSYIKSRVSPSKGSSSPTSPNASFDSGDGSPSFPAGAPTVNSHHQHSTTQQHPASTTSTTHPPHYSSPYTNNYPSATHHTSSRVGTGSGTTTAKVTAPSTASTTTTITTKTRKRSGGGRPFDPDAAHLSFTYRRELEKQQHEKQLVENLRTIIETRLKVSLPADISSALMDGVVLCHLANHVRPRSVSSIHVPSPAVPKLTIAKCRLNVENFLEACRRIGVEDARVCACDDIVTHFDPERVLTTVRFLVDPSESLFASKFNGAAPDLLCLGTPEEESGVRDQRTLSRVLMCIFLATVVLLAWYPPPDE
ncbi:leucine-rich repeat and calponin homology domain-containing protein-like isoform X5 [Eriocheir sinensis]|uniref:leucine-rich repeat and calponin homology domain-containing protein-like isoform X5 n=1 Tax=Eriocheir sinensis TaxID=95602 RepID=UPI0021C98DCE|nr:leucine-rich repeat and calponin homology domain-containing protein-like isoform X5 [Eriocheir sinensis]